MLRILRTIAFAAVRADDKQAFLVLNERFDVSDLGVVKLDFEVLRRGELPVRVGCIFEDFVLLLRGWYEITSTTESNPYRLGA
jgi:hypothetical protein